MDSHCKTSIESWTDTRISALRFIKDFVRFARLEGAKGTLLVAVGALLEGSGLLLLIPILNIVMARGDATRGAAAWFNSLFVSVDAHTQIERLVFLLACFSIVVAARALVLWYRTSVLAQLRIGFVETHRTSIVAKLAAAPWSQLSGFQRGRINHLLGSDIVLTGSCVHFLIQGLTSLLFLASQCAIAFLFSPLLAGIALCLMFGIGLALAPQLVKSRVLGSHMVEGNLLLAQSGSNFFGGLKLAISQNAQQAFVTEFCVTLSNVMKQQIIFTREQNKAQLTFGVISSLAGAAIIFIAIGFLDVRPAVLIAFVLLLARMSGPVAQLQQGAQQFANFLPSYECLKQLEAELKIDEPALENFSREQLPVSRIFFEDVSFRYGNGKGVSGLNLSIEPGSFIGVTGPSGGGKTTFADLLIGLAVPQRGAIFYRNRRLERNTRRLWRSLVAYVPQETFFFHDTVRNNLLWTNSAKSDHEIWDALHLAGADGFVSQLENGLDTGLSDKGSSLSGGERQRLAIARALLRKGPLLVLDEATSAIDIVGERPLLETLKSLSWHPTVVLIAHRASSLTLCDRVIEISNGHIISDESGTLQRHSSIATQAKYPDLENTGLVIPCPLSDAKV